MLFFVFLKMSTRIEPTSGLEPLIYSLLIRIVTLQDIYTCYKNPANSHVLVTWIFPATTEYRWLADRVRALSQLCSVSITVGAKGRE